MPQFFKTPPLLAAAFCGLVLLAACQQQSESFTGEQMAPPSPPSGGSAPSRSTAEAAPLGDVVANGDIFSSAAALPDATGLNKKFVRTAELRFRVKNAVEATLAIESIALRNGGFVISSKLQNHVDFRQTQPIHQDSLLETTRYSTHSQLIIRVPYTQLDTTLRSIGRLSEFLEHRQVMAEDVDLQLLEQELTRLRELDYQEELAQSAENKNSPKADRHRSSRAAEDVVEIEKRKLEDQIRFSTVQIALYQHPQLQKTMLANTEIALPEASFASRMGDALRAGREVLTLLFIGIVHLWGVILLAIAAYFTWKAVRKNKNPLSVSSQKSS